MAFKWVGKFLQKRRVRQKVQNRLAAESMILGNERKRLILLDQTIEGIRHLEQRATIGLLDAETNARILEPLLGGRTQLERLFKQKIAEDTGAQSAVESEFTSILRNRGISDEQVESMLTLFISYIADKCEEIFYQGYANESQKDLQDSQRQRDLFLRMIARREKRIVELNQLLQKIS